MGSNIFQRLHMEFYLRNCMFVHDIMKIIMPSTNGSGLFMQYL